MTRKERAVSDFCFINGRTDARLSDVERLTLLGGGGLDRAVARLSKGLSSVALHQLAPGLDPAQLLVDAERLRGLRVSGVLGELLRPPHSQPDPACVPVHGFPDGTVEDLFFESHFPPRSLGIDPQYESVSENRVSVVRLWEHFTKQEERQTIVAIHGWTMGDQRVNSLAFLPGLFFSLGWNVALVELPFHGRREPSTGAPFKGSFFPSSDPVRTFLGVSHAIFDLRALATYLAHRGHQRIACVGLSLGAYVGQLWASLEKLDKAVFIVPLVSMGDLAWEILRHQSENLTLELSRLSRPEGRTFFRDLFKDHCSLGREPATAQERILTIGGRGDQVVSRGQMDLLRKNWPHSNFVWLAGGHGAHLRRGEAFQLMREFLTK